MKKFILHLQMKWHTFRVTYNHALLAGCLDHQLKKKLQEKIQYHEMKLINGMNPSKLKF